MSEVAKRDNARKCATRATSDRIVCTITFGSIKMGRDWLVIMSETVRFFDF